MSQEIYHIHGPLFYSRTFCGILLEINIIKYLDGMKEISIDCGLKFLIAANLYRDYLVFILFQINLLVGNMYKIRFKKADSFALIL